MENLKLKNVIFFGFTKKELEEIKKKTGKSEEGEITFDFVQQCADVVGVDVVSLIYPGGGIAIAKTTGGAA